MIAEEQDRRDGEDGDHEWYAFDTWAEAVAYAGPELRLVCTATPGSPCRMRPADDRESWSYDDPDLIDGECWAVEWVEGGGMETVASADGVTWPTIPVTVEYDEGVVLAPVAPHPLLWPDGGAA